MTFQPRVAFFSQYEHLLLVDDIVAVDTDGMCVQRVQFYSAFTFSSCSLQEERGCSSSCGPLASSHALARSIRSTRRCASRCARWEQPCRALHRLEHSTCLSCERLNRREDRKPSFDTDNGGVARLNFTVSVSESVRTFYMPLSLDLPWDHSRRRSPGTSLDEE